MKITKEQTNNRKKYYVVYKISNIYNHKVYIGAHKIYRGNEDDGYICSSKTMLKLIAKNPKAFRKSILGRYTTASEADRFERLFITKYDSFRNGYNLSKNGGVYRCHGSKCKATTSEEAKKIWNRRKQLGDTGSLSSKKAWKTRKKKYGKSGKRRHND